MTRSELVTALARRLNKNVSSIDSATQSRLLDYLNEVHREVLTLPGAQRLRDATQTFATVANQTTYALVNVARILRVYEPNNRRVLREISPDQWRRFSPDPADVTGTPDSFAWLGLSPVAKQPSNASALFVDSTSGSDTGTCYLEGETEGGYARSVSVVMTGTTAVNVAASISDWVRVTKFYLSTAAVGAVTLHEDASGGTELARIQIGRTTQPYQLIALHPTPSAAVTHYVDYQSDATDLAQNTDVPRLPTEFHDLLIFGAMLREYEHMDDSRAGLAAENYRARKRAFLYWLAETASGQNTDFERPSRLGAWVASGGA